MTGNVNLTLKVSPELKEMLKALALENNTSVSQEVVKRLEQSLQAPAHDVDSQAVEEEDVTPLSAAELRQIRSLLKKKKKK
ncbi:hypothetical protein [Pantoea sp. 1.19]|uniref:hypothetical protein n=1 Tax=Pantoea sp. 1.19 TaxID=1925589 RepID=UPI000948931F|nr:hypothetical protein [Pantoea sp. 1.19]